MAWFGTRTVIPDWVLDHMAWFGANLVGGDAQRSWLDGGIGYTDDSGARVRAQFGPDIAHRLQWRARLHLLPNNVSGGRRAGVSEAFIERCGFDAGQRRWHLRAGLGFPPTSQENVDASWSSPCILTSSALKRRAANAHLDVGQRRIDLRRDFQTPND